MSPVLPTIPVLVNSLKRIGNTDSQRTQGLLLNRLPATRCKIRFATYLSFTPSFALLARTYVLQKQLVTLAEFTKNNKMHNKPGQKDPSILVKFVSAGLAASVAEAATIPIDTAKVRLQVSEWFDFRVICREVSTCSLDVCNLQL